MVAGMLMPLRDLRAIYEVLFRDGVMVAKKDKRPQAMHPEIEGVSNLQVIRAMGSLKSRGCVKETFAWRHFYWYLTNDGIVYLRDFLHLPPEIVPASLQRVRKQTATLAIAHRAARVQSVEGPTSYVPKPRYKGETESQDALAERQGYRHKMMGPGESDSYSDRTPRFRGRPLAAGPVRPKAPWEMQDESQPLFRKGDGFRREAVVEETMVKRVTHQQRDVSDDKPVTKSKEKEVSEIRKEKASISTQVQRAALKPDVSQTTLTSVSSKTVAAVAEATGSPGSKVPAELSAAKINEEKLKITDETISMRSSKMVTSKSAFTTLPYTELKEKPKKLTVGPVNPTEAIVEITPDNVKSQDVLTAVTAPTVIKTPVSKAVKEEKTTKVIADPVKSAEVKANAEKPSGKVKAQAVTTMVASQETPKVLTDSAAPVITKDISTNVKEEKPKREKVCEELVKSAEVKTPGEPKIHQEKATKRSQTTKPPPDTEPALPTETVNEFRVGEIQEADVTSLIFPTKPKPDEVLWKRTLLAESSNHEVKTIQTTQASAEDKEHVDGNVIVTEVIKKETKCVKEVTPHVEKDEKIEPGEVLKVLVQGPTLAQKDSSPPQLNQCATTEVVKENKQVVEGRSKSKRKKKKSPGEIIQTEELPDSKSEMETAIIDKPSGELANNPTPAITSEPRLRTGIKQERTSPVMESKTGVEIAIDGGKMKELSHKTDEKLVIEVPIQTVDQSMSKIAPLKSDPIPLVPPMELPGGAQVKEKGGSEMTLGSLRLEDKLNAQLLHTGPTKSEELTVTKVETVVVQKKTVVELKEASPAGLSQEPNVENKSPISTRKPAEESSKSRKKGKKQAQAPVSDAINAEPVFLLETLPSMNITSLHEAPVKAGLVMVSEPTEVSVSPKMTPERMCTEETRQAAAVLSEAPADKGEVEPTLLFAERIKREVPKPKTSSAARDAHAARELASAAPVAAAEAAAAQAQASPLSQQEEPPKVAQHSASQAAERCTEKQLSVSQAEKQEEEKKRDSEEDTPSGPVTQVAAQPEQLHLEHTCESIGSDVDEATMRKKIVVVEEIVEVKQVISPQPAGQLSSPLPVQPEVEGEELDLDVLEAIAIERALLSGAAGACAQGASPEQDWDHSLEEPEEKTWPNFIEGLFALINLLPALPHSLSLHVM